MSDEISYEEDVTEEPEAPRASGMYAKFQTDDRLETKGIVIDYGDFRVTVARAGGANKKYTRVLSAKTKPYDRAIANETMDDDVSKQILAEALAESVILLWEVKTGPDQWTKGIEAEDGSVLPFTTANVAATLNKLPDLLGDLMQQSSKMALFRKDVLEAQAGN